MIIVGTKLRVIDNSGAKRVRCIRILNRSAHRLARVGDYLVVSVKRLRRNLPKKKVSIGQVTMAVVLSTRQHVQRATGFSISNYRGSVALIDRAKQIPIGSRVAAGVFHEIRLRGLVKLLILARHLW